MLSPLSQFFLTANYSKFRAPNTNIQTVTSDGFFTITSIFTDVESRTRSFKTGFNHVFSGTMQGTLMLGRRKTETERGVIQCLFFCVSGSQLTDDTGTTFSGDLKKQFEKLDVTATISRDLAASGTGTQVEWDSLSIRFDRPFTARLKGVLTVNGSESRRIDDISSLSTDIKQYSIQPALHWGWTREADLSVAYRYRHLKRESEDKAAQSRAIYLTLAYAWTKYSVSR
jgi:hypothetical protein